MIDKKRSERAPAVNTYVTKLTTVLDQQILINVRQAQRNRKSAEPLIISLGLVSTGLCTLGLCALMHTI
jgi:hypothetical protein